MHKWPSLLVININIFPSYAFESIQMRAHIQSFQSCWSN